MSLFEVFAVLIALSALFSYVNLRYFRLPPTIGLMLMSLLLSLALVLSGELVPELEGAARGLLDQVDFSAALLHGMLAFLLFAGSLHVNLGDLYLHRWVIGWLATLGVLLSTFLVGGLTWLIFNAFGIKLSLLYCFSVPSFLRQTL